MLIDGQIIANLLQQHGVSVTGVLHIGAHECEERPFYNCILKVSDDDILWIDGNRRKVEEMQRKGSKQVFHAVLDETVHECTFNITDNSQASSLLTLNHDEGFYRNIHIVETQVCTTETLEGFFATRGLTAAKYNFWNLDIQGSELSVIRGSQSLLASCDAIYTEVNRRHVYKQCGLVDELDALLAAYGFERVLTKWTDVEWGDALYVRRAKDSV